MFRGWATSEANAKAGKIWKADGAWVSTAAAKGKTLNVYAVWKAGKTAAAGATGADADPDAPDASTTYAFSAAAAALCAEYAEGDVPTCVSGPLADGSGEYVMTLDDAGCGLFSVEAEGCSFTASCEAAKYGEYIVVTLDDGRTVVISADGTAEVL